VVLNPMAIAAEAERPAGEGTERAENAQEQISAAPSTQPVAAAPPTAREPRRAAAAPKTAKAS